MFANLPKCLAILLVLLQFVAPLVHAHTGNLVNAPEGMLHVPGLEMLAVSDNKACQFQAVSVGRFSEGLVFGVNTGIKHSDGLDLLNTNQDHCLPPPTLASPSQVFFVVSRVFPTSALCAKHSPSTSHSPRAPPIS